MTAELRGRLSKVTKFVLASDFAIAADQFRNDFDNLEKGPKFCRLPFAECWVEFSQADRTTARIEITSENQFRKKRIGYLLTQTDPDGAFEGNLFISTDDPRRLPVTWIMAPTILHYDPHSASFDNAYREREIYLTGQSVEQSRAYWQGESRYLAAVLELLQSRNATEVSPLLDLSRLIHQRARRNKPLLVSYHLVSIPARY